MFRFRTFMFMAVAVAMAGLAQPAQADFRMRVEDNTGVATPIGTGGAGGTGATITGVTGAPGSITLLGKVGSFVINVTTGLEGGPGVMGPNYASLDLNTVTISSATGGDLRLLLENTGFTGGPLGSLVVNAGIGGTLTAGAGSTLTAQSWVNGGNLVPGYGADAGAVLIAPNTWETTPFPGVGGGVALGALGAAPGGSVIAFTPLAYTTGPGAFSGSGFNFFTNTGTYSLFVEVDVHFAGAGQVSFDEMQTVTPAPGGLVLALSALPFVGGYLRRRLRKQA